MQPCKRPLGRPAARAAIAAAGVFFALPARGQPAEDPRAAAAIVGELERDTAHAASIAEPLGQAKAAIERATRFRAAGDEAHAKAADGLALEWAQVAREVVRAADAEAAAA